MQDNGKELDLEKGFKIEIFDMWEFSLVDNKLEYPGYEISFNKKRVYMSSDTTKENIKKLVLNATKDICQVNYGGGRENPFIEWLSKNANIQLISK